MAPTAENSQNVLDALTTARDHLVEARDQLTLAKALGAIDYPGNNEGIENLPGATKVLLKALVAEITNWNGWNDSRQRWEN